MRSDPLLKAGSTLEYTPVGGLFSALPSPTQSPLTGIYHLCTQTVGEAGPNSWRPAYPLRALIRGTSHSPSSVNVNSGTRHDSGGMLDYLVLCDDRTKRGGMSRG